MIAGQLVRRWSSEPNQVSIRGRLTPGQTRKTLEAIEAGMSSGIRIAALADQLGTGAHQFTRLFRQRWGTLRIAL